MILVILLPLVTACGSNNDVTHVGVNAEILEISNVVKGIVVKGLDNNSILGDECRITTYFVYLISIDFTYLF